MSTSWTVDELEALPRRDVQKLAKEHGIKANGKTIELVKQLVAHLIAPLQQPISSAEKVQSSSSSNDNDNDNDNIPLLKDEELMDVTEMSDDEDDAMDDGIEPCDTFIIEGKDANSNPQMTATFTIEKENVLSSTHITDDIVSGQNEEMLLTADEPTLASGGSGMFNLTSTLNQEPVASANVNAKCEPAKTGRYADQHKQQFENMESISDAKRRVQQRHKDVMASVPASISRLATPKTGRRAAQTEEPKPAVTRFRTPSGPHEENFKFGNVPTEKIASVQRPYVPLAAKSPRPRRACARKPQTDVKELTKNAAAKPKRLYIASTMPDDSPNLVRLATPKSAGKIPISKERRSFTPKTGRFSYIDTTKMSNAEFALYQKRQRQANAAEQKRVF